MIAHIDQEKSFTGRNWGPTWLARRLSPKPIREKVERSGPPSANQGQFYSQSQKQPCSWPIAAGTEPKSQGHCQKWHHKSESYSDKTVGLLRLVPTLYVLPHLHCYSLVPRPSPASLSQLHTCPLNHGLDLWTAWFKVNICRVKKAEQETAWGRG